MDIYNNIDILPLRHYINVVESGKLVHLFKSEIPEKPDYKKLNEIWNTITQQIFDIDLKDKSFAVSLMDEKLHYLRKIKAALTEKALDKIHYKMQAEKFEKKVEPFDFERSIAILESKIGQIDDMKMTVKRYFTHMNILKNSINGK